MAQQTPVDLNQTEPNALSAIADQERPKLITKNDYNKIGNEYSSVNKDAVADGDSMGRGTGTFLDVYNTSISIYNSIIPDEIFVSCSIKFSFSSSLYFVVGNKYT